MKPFGALAALALATLPACGELPSEETAEEIGGPAVEPGDETAAAEASFDDRAAGREAGPAEEN